MSHLGSRVSALLDGHLTPAEEERCWSHVHSCHACRDLVEREGWVKTRLAQLSLGSSCAPDRLKDSLLGHQGALAAQPFSTAGSPRAALAERSRHRGLVAIGGGAAGACVVGVLALGLAGSPRVDPRPPVTDIPGPSAVNPTPLTERFLLAREKMAR